MTRPIAAGAAGLLLVAPAIAQTTTATAQPTQSPLSPFFSTGTPVGRSVLSPVGKAPGATPAKAGTPVGYRGPDGRTIAPAARPEGQVIDLKNLAAPVSAPLTPNLAALMPKSPLEKAYDKWRSLIGLGQPAGGQSPTNFTPGLSRRARERREAQWRRD